MTMTWHYQILRHREKSGSTWCAIHEVYADMLDTGDDTGLSWTEQPIAAIGDDEDDVIRTLSMMLADAANRPVLEVDA